MSTTYIAVLGIHTTTGKDCALEVGGFTTPLAAIVAASHAMGHPVAGITEEWVTGRGGDTLDELSFEDVSKSILSRFTIERYTLAEGTDESWSVKGGLRVRPLHDQESDFEEDECTEDECTLPFRHHNHIGGTS